MRECESGFSFSFLFLFVFFWVEILRIFEFGRLTVLGECVWWVEGCGDVWLRVRG